MERRKVAVLCESVSYFNLAAEGVVAYSLGQEPFWMRRGVPTPDAARGLATWRPDGVIAAIRTQEMLEAVEQLGCAVVNLSGDIEGLPLPAVLPDEEAVGRLAAEHLLSRHLPHLAMIGVEQFGYVKQRRQGFERALGGRPHHYIDHRDLERSGDHWWDWAPRYRRWIESLPRPLGIFAWNDLDGSYAIDACHMIGVRVPEEVAVLSVENDRLVCELSYPAMSSVDLNVRRIGYEAARLLVQLMDGHPPPPGPVRVQPLGVVPRLSTDVAAIDDPVLVEAVRLMRQHAMTPTSIDELVQMLPISRRELEIRFRDRLDRTPLHYLHELRIERARQMLAETEMSMPQIAAASGFGTVRQFTTIFKRLVRQTPSDYRRATRLPAEGL